MGSGRKTVRLDAKKLPVPSQAPDDYSSGAFCVKLSPQWFAVMQGMIDHLRIRSMWRWNTAGQWSDVKRWIETFEGMESDCETCPDCPDCPDLPPPVQGGGNGGMGSGQETGSMGYTIDELEEMLQMAITKIEWRGSELWYRDGCCDWYQVLDASGSQFVASSAINKPEGQTLQEWAAAGKPNLSTGQTPVTSDNPFYTTSDSMACAKATAIVEFFKLLLQTTADGVGTSSLSITGLTQALSTASASLGFPDAGLILEFAVVVIGAITGGTALQFNNEVNDALEDTNWDDVICQSVPLMAPIVTVGLLIGNQVTESDVNAVYQKCVELITMSDDVRQVLQTYPLSAIQDAVRAKLPDQDCGCDQYLPYNYSPSPDSGKIQHVRMISSGSAGINDWYEPVSLEAITAVQHGTKTGSTGYKTSYIGTSGGKFYQGAGILLLLPTGIEISNVKYNVAWNGSYDEVKLGFYEFLSDGSLHAIVYFNDAAGSYDKIVNGTADATHMIIEVKGSGNTGTGQYVDLTGLLFSGTKPTGSFVDKAIGEIL